MVTKTQCYVTSIFNINHLNIINLILSVNEHIRDIRINVNVIFILNREIAMH